MKISLHAGQLTVFEDTHKIRTVCAGRRFGKTRLLINEILIGSLEFPGRIDPVSPETVLATAPTQAMARQLIWKPLTSLLKAEPRLLKAIASINNTELRIDWKGGKPPIIVAGTNDKDGDSLRGKRLWRYFGDEYQDTKPGVFDTVIQPAMADTKGSRALLTFTPKGTLNHSYELFQRATVDPETYKSFHRSTLDNPFVPTEEVDRARLLLPERIFKQEFLASFETFLGQIFDSLSPERNQVEASEVPEDFDMVILGHDFGDVNPAIITIGLRQGIHYVLEGWKGNTGRPIAQPEVDSQLVRLAAKYGVMATYCDPSRPSSILGIRTLGKEYRLKGLQKALAGYNRIEEGINQQHGLIYQGRLKFPKQAPWITPGPGTVTPLEIYRMFESYRRATGKDGNPTDAVAEGQDDHLIDACRYAIARDNGFLGSADPHVDMPSEDV